MVMKGRPPPRKCIDLNPHSSESVSVNHTAAEFEASRPSKTRLTGVMIIPNSHRYPNFSSPTTPSPTFPSPNFPSPISPITPRGIPYHPLLSSSVVTIAGSMTQHANPQLHLHPASEGSYPYPRVQSTPQPRSDPSSLQPTHSPISTYFYHQLRARHSLGEDNHDPPRSPVIVGSSGTSSEINRVERGRQDLETARVSAQERLLPPVPLCVVKKRVPESRTRDGSQGQ